MDEETGREIQVKEKAVLTDERHWSLSISETTMVIFSIIWILMLLPAMIQLGSHPLLLTNVFSGAALLLMSNHVLKGKRKMELNSDKLEVRQGYLPWHRKIEIDNKEIKSVFLSKKKLHWDKSSKKQKDRKPELWISLKNGEKIKLLEAAPTEEFEYFHGLRGKIIDHLNLDIKAKRKRLKKRRAKQRKLAKSSNKERRQVLQYGNDLLDKPVGRNIEFQELAWTIEFRYQYDWPNEKTDHFLSLKNNQESIFFFFRDSTGVRAIFREEIVRSGVINRKKKINQSSLRSKLRYRDQLYLKEFSGKGPIFRNANARSGTAIQLLYLNEKENKSLRIFRELGKETLVFAGTLQDSID